MTQSFASALQIAARDRRMSKIKMSIVPGGIKRAIEKFKEVNTPDLLVLETSDTGYGIFSDLEGLAEVCDENTKVLIAGTSNDVSLYRELIRQGVSEYVVTPVSAIQLIDAIRSIYEEPDTAPKAKIFSVVGVKGGTGSSVISHNVAWHIAEDLGRETLIVDMDLEFGTSALDYNIDIQRGLVDAFLSIDSLDDAKLRRLIYDQTDRLQILSNSGTLLNSIDVTGEHTQILLDILRNNFSVVVLDLPHNWTEVTQTALHQSDEIVFVSTPDLACLRNLKFMYQKIVEQRQNDAKPYIVVNQFGMSKRPEIPIKEFEDILGRSVDTILPFDPVLFGKASNNGEMLAEISKDAQATKLIRILAQKLNGRDDISERQKASSFINVLSSTIQNLSKKKPQP
jgi:pilus assembly protein CpaE